ncbi:YceI family protein [uncultured Croceitalea sp.]|uniref:YceI family protein n=1 Tax=uncultured Croceitalea sp. TaxID=1798908 RepID=UPI0033060260
MKNILLIAWLATTLSLTAQNKAIKSAEVTFEFVAKGVDGTIAGFTSASTIDFDNLQNSVFKGAVAVETLDTDNGLRNWSLKGRKYFNEDSYPKISFESTTITQKDDTYKVQGTLTLKGTKKPLTITFTKNGNTLVGKASLYTSDFGINIKKKREDNLVKITFRFVLS